MAEYSLEITLISVTIDLLHVTLFLTDLSFMEEWTCRGKTLERHDGSSSYCCIPVAFSEGVRKPAITLHTVIVNTSLSASALSTYPLYTSNCSRVMSLFSGLFDIGCPQSLWHHFLKFHPVKIRFPLGLKRLWCLYSFHPRALMRTGGILFFKILFILSSMSNNHND